MSLQRVRHINAGLGARPPVFGIQTKEAPPNGIIWSGYTDTYVVSNPLAAGAIVVAPGDTDSGTVTLINEGAVPLTVYGLASLPVLNIPANSQVKIGSASMDYGASFFDAVLSKVDVATAIWASNAHSLNLFKHSQTDLSGAGRPNRRMAIGDESTSDPSSAVRRQLFYGAEGFATGGITPGTKTVITVGSGTTAPTPAVGGGGQLKCNGFGNTTAGATNRNNAPANDWAWYCAAGRGASDAESGVNTMTTTSGNLAANAISVGMRWVPRQGLAVLNTATLHQRIGSGELSQVDAGGNYATTTGMDVAGGHGQDWLLGDTSFATKYAGAIHTRYSPRLQDILLMMSGLDRAGPVVGRQEARGRLHRLLRQPHADRGRRRRVHRHLERGRRADDRPERRPRP
jgi:hypothetical protein